MSTAPVLTPAAVQLLNAIAAATAAPVDPWAKFPPVLGVAHVAEVMGMSEDAVRAGARCGRLPLKKRVGRYVVDQVAFRSWLAEGGAR